MYSWINDTGAILKFKMLQPHYGKWIAYRNRTKNRFATHCNDFNSDKQQTRRQIKKLYLFTCFMDLYFMLTIQVSQSLDMFYLSWYKQVETFHRYVSLLQRKKNVKVYNKTRNREGECITWESHLHYFAVSD